MKYKYTAVDNQGDQQKGYVRAESRRAALNVLKNADLKVKSLENRTSVSLLERITGLFNHVGLRILWFFPGSFLH